MKTIIILLLTACCSVHCIAQVTEKKAVVTDQKITTVTTAPVTAQKALVVIPAGTNRTVLDTHKNINPKVDRTNAVLQDIFAYAYTGFDEDLGCGKDHDTHWSFGLFDQNDRPVASFHDDSDNDEYQPLTGASLKMHVDYPTKFSDFAKGGRIHVNIAPNGHDTWDFESLALTIDFINPNFTLKISFAPGILSQDRRDTDLYFSYNGENFVAR